MKRKKILFIIIIILVVIGVLLYMKFTKKEEVLEAEITPLEEMTEEQERQTMISLYYTNIETNTLMPEARVIDVKELVENPYKVLVELLIEKPKNEKFESSIPEGTKVNNAVLKNNVVEIDLSKEFIENQKGDVEKASLSIYSIVNTLTELNEVNAVKILVDGDSNKKFNNIELSLKDVFIRKS
ncbi:MAG: GerMN domain-containing protein [Clostridia bacterium]|nr:GerMN domain-containing protein [Clostridia bacterium]